MTAKLESTKSVLSKSTLGKSAFDRLVGYLSRRDHSIRELSNKLKKFHDNDEIIAALERADDFGYLKNPKELSKKLADSLLRKGRGLQWIRAQLRKKNLPQIEVSEGDELDRAWKVVSQKLKAEPPFTREQRIRVYRLLCNRGFSPSVARQISLQGAK